MKVGLLALIIFTFVEITVLFVTFEEPCEGLDPSYGQIVLL